MILPKAGTAYDAGEEQRTRHTIEQGFKKFTSLFQKSGEAVFVNLLGTVTNDDAAAGRVGELKLASLIRASAVNLTSGTPTNVVGLMLTPGDWDVSGVIVHYPAVTTVVSAVAGWVSDVSASFPTPPTPGVSKFSWPASFVPNDDLILSLSNRRFALASTTTIYLSAIGYFSTSTLKAFGTVNARRAR